MSYTAIAHDPHSLLEAAIVRAQVASGLPIAFGGLVRTRSADSSHLTITSLRGTATTSLANLRVRAGEGLGGKTLAMQRPASVRSYPTAQGITRRYDHAVAPERLEAILSVPVHLPGRAPVAIIYLALRQQADLGDRVQDRLRPVLTETAHELELIAGVEQRLHRAREDWAAAAPAERPELVPDLRALMELTTDPATRAGLAAVLERLAPAIGATAPGGSGASSPLTPRETQVLRAAETGATNAEIGLALGLAESTVKSYMKATLAKIGADNRVRAARSAREAGWL